MLHYFHMPFCSLLFTVMLQYDVFSSILIVSTSVNKQKQKKEHTKYTYFVLPVLNGLLFNASCSTFCSETRLHSSTLSA